MKKVIIKSKTSQRSITLKQARKSLSGVAYMLLKECGAVNYDNKTYIFPSAGRY